MEVFAQSNEHFITSITVDRDGSVFGICASSGEVVQAVPSSKLFVSVGTTDTTPIGLTVDPKTHDFLLANHADQCIMTCRVATAAGASCTTTTYFNRFEGRTLVGPTAVAICPVSDEVFFSDAGYEGDSSIANPIGAVFRTVQGRSQLVPLCATGLQQPTGLAVGRDGCVYVCEQSANRLLRFVPRGNHYVGSVFRQFQGSMGPVGVAVHPADGSVYVAMYEPSSVGSVYSGSGDAEDGRVMVLDRHGADKGTIVTPGSQLRAVAMGEDGSCVYVLLSDENTCSSTVYCCTL